MNEIIAKFIKNKNARCPISGQPMSKNKRMDEMYKIVTNVVYNVEYSKAERLLAAEFIKQILEED
jgi:hypothetical protein